MTHSEIVSFLWSVADLIRDTFKRGKYQDVILPFTVLRRLDCVLAPTKKKVLEKNSTLKGKLENLDPQLRRASGFAFYNTSKYDFRALLDDHAHLMDSGKRLARDTGRTARAAFLQHRHRNLRVGVDEQEGRRA